MRGRSVVRQSSSSEADGQIDLTPMLDVVFIMLIFFIVTASFIREAGIDVQRPESATRELVANQKILIAISAENEIWVDKRQVDKRSLKAVIERMHAENPKGAVVIQADEKSNAEAYAAVFDAARAVGITNIALAASEQ